MLALSLVSLSKYTEQKIIVAQFIIIFSPCNGIRQPIIVLGQSDLVQSQMNVVHLILGVYILLCVRDQIEGGFPSTQLIS
jgi:hypothetical protein